jgi:predicted flavoprotein YhiN
MQVRGIENLFVCGELLDLSGPIGGLSFQSAFATAELAARAIATSSSRN